MRKNKTYEQQKKFYDKNNAYESLGALFFEWLTSGYMTAKQMQDVYREGTKECKEYIFEDLFHLVGQKTFFQFVLESSTLARSNMERSANRGAHHVQAVRPHKYNN